MRLARPMTQLQSDDTQILRCVTLRWPMGFVLHPASQLAHAALSEKGMLYQFIRDVSLDTSLVSTAFSEAWGVLQHCRRNFSGRAWRH